MCRYTHPVIAYERPTRAVKSRIKSSQVKSSSSSSQKGEGGVEGCEGADGVEQRAASAAHEAEGDDGDEAMEGVENISLQPCCSQGCSMPRGAGARPAASRRRSRREGQMSRSPRSSDKMVNDRAGHARHEGPVLPSWDVNEEPKEVPNSIARGLSDHEQGPRALRSRRL